MSERLDIGSSEIESSTLPTQCYLGSIYDETLKGELVKKPTVFISTEGS